MNWDKKCSEGEILQKCRDLGGKDYDQHPLTWILQLSQLSFAQSNWNSSNTRPPSQTIQYKLIVRYSWNSPGHSLRPLTMTSGLLAVWAFIDNADKMLWNITISLLPLYLQIMHADDVGLQVFHSHCLHHRPEPICHVACQHNFCYPSQFL